VTCDHAGRSLMATAKSSIIDTPNYEFEEGSSSEGSTDGYVTPNEDVVEDQFTTSDPEAKMQVALGEAEELKSEGTEYFRASRWTNALQSYRRALARLPPRKSHAKHLDKGKGKDGNDEELCKSDKDGIDEQALTPLEHDCAKARAILSSNIGACHVKLGEHKEAVAACTEALLDDPQYVKALHRRAMSNDHLDTWSSLVAAEEDYKRLSEILPLDSPLRVRVQHALQGVTPRREAAQKAEMGEMMDKLKGLGNSLLGNFGLSTDNFKFEPNGQGGYSINFAQG